MNHFSFKSLAFYGIAISSVVVLFKVVTAYGNTHLNAPPSIGGDYAIDSQNLPECLKTKNLILNIQQSGVYLFGSLEATSNQQKSEPATEKRPLLNGRFSQEKFSLEGTSIALKTCQELTTSTIKLEGLIKEKILTGQLLIDSKPMGEFTATKEDKPEKSGDEH